MIKCMGPAALRYNGNRTGLPSRAEISDAKQIS